MNDLRFTSNILQVLSVMLSQPGERQYALELSKVARVGIGSIYSTLARLEHHKLVMSMREEIDPVVEKRPPRRYYLLTQEGIKAAQVEIAAAQRMLALSGVAHV